MRRSVVLALSCFLSLSTSNPALGRSQISGSTGQRSVAIVELFTSEGCSSCPPADALLQQIHLKQATSGQLIIGLSEHVTYWDRLGWKDPFSDEVFTDRQNGYAQRSTDQGPYTPQMVLNGREQFVGSDSARLQQALLADASRPHAALTIESVSRQADGAELKLSLSETTSKPLDIIAVFTDDFVHSVVARGENGGRSLEHVSVARGLQRVTVMRGAGEQSIHLSWPKGFMGEHATRHHLVVFAQEPHQGAISTLR